MKTSTSTPPDTNVSVVSHTNKLYKYMYIIGNKISKRDKLGIHKTIENACLEVLTLLLQASFENQNNKRSSLEQARVQIEILKNLVRLEHELKIIPEKTYIYLERELIEISKMTNGWIKYIENLSTSRG